MVACIDCDGIPFEELSIGRMIRVNDEWYEVVDIDRTSRIVTALQRSLDGREIGSVIAFRSPPGAKYDWMGL
jgi:hypothetical protein